MKDSLFDLRTLGLRYVCMQHEAARSANAEAMRQHITRTLCRCLPGCIVTPRLVEDFYTALQGHPSADDPMCTGAIHAVAGQYLLHAASCENPLLQRLHRHAHRFLPADRPASRDDLRLVTLAALYDPRLLPSSEIQAFVRHRLGLVNGIPLSCEEIAARMHKPLVYIHELEAAVLTALSAHQPGGPHA